MHNTHTLPQAFRPSTVELQFAGESWNGQHIIWYRDPIEVIQNLFGNPLYKDDMVYAAEKHTDVHGHRLYSEMHWSNWWWDVQVCCQGKIIIA